MNLVHGPLISGLSNLAQQGGIGRDAHLLRPFSLDQTQQPTHQCVANASLLRTGPVVLTFMCWLKVYECLW